MVSDSVSQLPYKLKKTHHITVKSHLDIENLEHGRHVTLTNFSLNGFKPISTCVRRNFQLEVAKQKLSDSVKLDQDSFSFHFEVEIIVD